MTMHKDALTRLARVVNSVHYKDDWYLRILPVDQSCNHFYLQVHFTARDVITGVDAVQKGRKWLLSEFMTDTEIVVTAYKAIEAAELHELREKFKYRGRAIYSPHLNLTNLADVIDESIGYEIRPEKKA